MKAIWRAARGNQENALINRIKKIFPTYESYMSNIGSYSNRKIVLYSQIPETRKYINNIMGPCQWISANNLDQSDTDKLLLNSARSLLGPIADNKQTQVILQGFPMNPNHALQLDKYINGINLAIYLTNGQDTQFRHQISQILAYYSKTGNLAILNYEQNPSKAAIIDANREIMSKIKINPTAI